MQFGQQRRHTCAINAIKRWSFDDDDDDDDSKKLHFSSLLRDRDLDVDIGLDTDRRLERGGRERAHNVQRQRKAMNDECCELFEKNDCFFCLLSE